MTNIAGALRLRTTRASSGARGAGRSTPRSTGVPMSCIWRRSASGSTVAPPTLESRSDDRPSMSPAGRALFAPQRTRLRRRWPNQRGYVAPRPASGIVRKSCLRRTREVQDRPISARRGCNGYASVAGLVILAHRRRRHGLGPAVRILEFRDAGLARAAAGERHAGDAANQRGGIESRVPAVFGGTTLACAVLALRPVLRLSAPGAAWLLRAPSPTSSARSA